MGLLDYAGFNSAVANHLAMTVAELPQVSLDSWYKEATARIIAKDRRWPFMSRSDTFDTVASQSEYPITDLDDQLLSVASLLVSGNRKLRWIGRDEADIRYFTTSSVGSPYYWSEGTADTGAKTIRLHTTPSGIETIIWRGYVRPSDWVTATSVTDFPPEFDDVIIDWAVGRLYFQQEMPAMGNQYMGLAETMLDHLHSLYRGMPDPSPQVMGIGLTADHWEFGRLRNPWD